MAKKSYRLRRLHRFLGVTVGIQMLFWTISGLYFAWSDLDTVHGDPQKNPPPALAVSDSMCTPALVLENLRRAEGRFDLMDLRLVQVLDRSCWQITYQPNSPHTHGADLHAPKKTRLADAVSGELRAAINEAEAVAMAQKAFNGASEVQKVEYVTKVNGHHEFRDDPLPAYAVTFNHPSNTTVYVSAERGTVQKFRNDAWRVFDLLWMFHTMDYRSRDDINNWVLRGFSILGLLTVGSGFALFFMTIKRRKNA
ncbi:MAG: PepSY domain-containing protein [Saprospiraceae bacterium]|nr:PepSY domain-containing protein [Saprospiraceae bacterium]